MSEQTMSNPGWINDIKVLSFDLDDTLWDCPPAIANAEAKLYAWFQKHAPRVVAVHEEKTVLIRRAEIVNAHPELIGDMTLLRHKIIEVLLTESGYSASDADIAFDVFYRARSEVLLYPGTHAVLDELGQHYRLAVITNGNADLSLIGLAEKFSHIQRASVDNRPKPDPFMFQACLANYGIPPSALAHIGDNAVADVGGAQGVGARSVWYKQPGALWPWGQPTADAHVTSLQELLDLFIPEFS